MGANQEVAKEIIRQLTGGGAGRLKAILGAKDIFALNDKRGGISFKFPNQKRSKPNYCKIVLTDDDLYDVEFGRINKLNYKVIETATDIFDDMLKPIFEKATELYTSI